MHFGTGMSVVCVKRSFRELQFFSCLVDVFVDLTVSKVGAFCRGRNLPSARGLGT